MSQKLEEMIIDDKHGKDIGKFEKIRDLVKNFCQSPNYWTHDSL